MFVNHDVKYSEYAGYYYLTMNDGTIMVRVPGSHEFLPTLPNYEVFTRFAHAANQLFILQHKPLALHLTGCKRCQKSVDDDKQFFDPCRTGGPMIMAGKEIAQEISRKVAKDFAEWWDTEQQRLHADAESVAQDTEGVPDVRSD